MLKFKKRYLRFLHLYFQQDHRTSPSRFNCGSYTVFWFCHLCLLMYSDELFCDDHICYLTFYNFIVCLLETHKLLHNLNAI